MLNYNGKIFKALSNSANGEVAGDLEFHYRQEGDVIDCSYQGGVIVQGHLIGKVLEGGVIKMSYHQINTLGEIRTGVCTSIPEIQPNGKIRLHESWQWTNGDCSKGESILEEL